MARYRTFSTALARTRMLPAWAGGPAVFLFAAMGLVALSLLRPGLATQARTSITDLASPVVSAVTAPLQNTGIAVRQATGLAGLQAENVALRAETARLADWHRQAMTLEAENARLRALLNVTAPQAQTTVTARIMADGGQAFAHTLLVQAGATDGVRVGQAALGPAGLAGRVVEVGQNTARVLLLTDVNAQVPVLLGAKGPRAVVTGDNAGGGALTYIPDSASLTPGAHVVTSGHGGLLPPGVAVGRVTQGGGVAFYTDFSALTHLRIVTSPAAAEATGLLSVAR